MQLTLVRNDTIFRLPLPEKVGGQYWLTSSEPDGSETQLLSVEGAGGTWLLKSNRRAWVLDRDKRRVAEAALDVNDSYEIIVGATRERLLVRTEPTTDDRKLYVKYSVPRNARIYIGRGEGCAIRYESGFVSSKHAEITLSGESTTIADLDSVNGTFVNSRRVTSTTLRPGDVISVFGLNIVVGRGFLALNDPDGLVTCDSTLLTPAEPRVPMSSEDEVDDEERNPNVVFFRSPRFKRDVTTAHIKIDPPPQIDDREDMPLLMVVGPAMTMGMASMFMGVFAVLRVLNPGPGQTPGSSTQWLNALPTLIMSMTMMVGMILWPILSRRYERRQRRKREAKRQTKYRAYLEDVQREIEAARRTQAEILHETIITLQDCIERIRTRARSLWERTTGHNDFLSFRLGIGEVVFDAEIRHAERKFTLEDDDLQDIMLDIAEEPRKLPDVPIQLSLLEHPILGVIGDRAITQDLVKGIILQLAALHGYDELKMVFIYDPRDAATWEFCRWLPHTWSDDRTVRFIATSHEDLRRLTSLLEPSYAAREEIHGDADATDLSPHCVVFALDKTLAGKNDFIKRILDQKSSRGFYLVALDDELQELPRECRAVIEAKSSGARIYDREDTTGAYRAFVPDALLRTDATELAVCLAGTELDTMSDAFVLPAMLTFLELHGVGKVEHLNPLTRWKESNPIVSLEAAVGVGTNGEHLRLDIHENRHGPHGLIAGMTGSGKSEFIMTYILSLAVTYSPDELAFVLIDYKGGGMANAFSDLPHVAGTITNLDGAAVNRSLISIQSELKRRQAIFNDASAATGTSNIDIYKYQSLYRDGSVSEPLPHLVIISDEFAELKTQQPEFMTQLVSAARIGRSLGVHLVLATQKPSGVVNEQIWSNSRFRVCLKVQERADSMEVIKRPDAAALTQTGRFYLQVGFDEIFEQGQSAWAGAPYQPADRVEKARDESVVLIDDIGRPLRQAQIDRRRRLSAHPPKQLDEVARYITQVAAEEGMRTRPLWLDPMPDLIFADALRQKYRRRSPAKVLDPVVGEWDDPANQRQALLTVPLTERGNAVVYGSTGSGKTTFLTTLIHSLITEHDPSQVHLYVIDFEAETLRAFQKAPHVGDVLGSNDTEKISNLFKMLAEEVSRRRTLFAEYGGNLEAYVQDSGRALESIVVVVHNWAAFIEGFHDLEETISTLTRDGTRYGLYFVLTATSSTAIRFRLLQNFRQLYVLQLNDPTEYVGILGSIGGVVPSQIDGRGIVKTDATYEFQTAHPSQTELGDAAYVREACGALAESWGRSGARPVPVLPDLVTADALLDEANCPDLGAVPVGIDAQTLDVVEQDFARQFVTLVLSQDGEASPFIDGIASVLADRCGTRTVVLDSGAVLPESHAGRYEAVRGEAAANEAAAALFEEMVARNNRSKEAAEAQRQQEAFEPLVCLVPELSALLDSLTPENRDRFTAILLKCDATLRATFIFADSEGAAAPLLRQPWLKPHVSGTDGIWVGDGFATQYSLQAAKTSNALYQEIGGEFGYVLTKGRPRLVKLLAGGPEASERVRG